MRMFRRRVRALRTVDPYKLVLLFSLVILLTAVLGCASLRFQPLWKACHLTATISVAFPRPVSKFFLLSLLLAWIPVFQRIGVAKYVRAIELVEPVGFGCFVSLLLVLPAIGIPEPGDALTGCICGSAAGIALGFIAGAMLRSALHGLAGLTLGFAYAHGWVLFVSRMLLQSEDESIAFVEAYVVCVLLLTVAGIACGYRQAERSAALRNSLRSWLG